MSTGAAAFLGKPFKKADLLAIVRRVLDGDQHRLWHPPKDATP